MSEERPAFGRPEIPEIGTQLRLWRKHLDLKQEELEVRAGLSHNAVSRIERGLVSPKFDTIDRLAQSLNISVEELQFRTPRTAIKEERAHYLESVVERISRLPEVKQKRMLESISPLLDLLEEDS